MTMQDVLEMMKCIREFFTVVRLESGYDTMDSEETYCEIEYLKEDIFFVKAKRIEIDGKPYVIKIKQEVDEKICDLYKLKWKNCSNTRKRMDWLEVLGLIDIIGNRKWVVTESGKRALKEWILVTPEMLDSFEDAEVSYKISEAPTEISNMIQEFLVILYLNQLI